MEKAKLRARIALPDELAQFTEEAHQSEGPVLVYLVDGRLTSMPGDPIATPPTPICADYRCRCRPQGIFMATFERVARKFVGRRDRSRRP
jgi:hypothetical protein